MECISTKIRFPKDSKMAVGFIPDLVIVDYFECMKLEKGTMNDEWENREDVLYCPYIDKPTEN